MKRNAAVVLGNVGRADDVEVLTRALDGADALVREHAAWALRRLADGGQASPPPSEAGTHTPDASVP